MSTNYYLNDTQGKTIHVGKSSLGWQFLFDTVDDPIKPVRTFADWIDYLNDARRVGYVLEDEYGRSVTVGAFIDRVMESQRTGKNCWTATSDMAGPRWGRPDDDGYFFDSRGFWFSTSRDFG